MNHTIKRLSVTCMSLLLLAAGCSTAGKLGQPGSGVPKITAAEAPQVREKALEVLKAGDMSAAQSQLMQVVAATPNDPKALFLLGVTQYNKKQYDEAIETYKKALAVDPKFIEAQNNLGNTYRDMKKTEDAISAYKKTIEMAPNFVYAYTNLAGVYSAEGKPAEAVKVMEAAVVANPESLDLKYGLAAAYKASGEKVKAIEALEALLKIQPENKAAADLMNELKK